MVEHRFYPVRVCVCILFFTSILIAQSEIPSKVLDWQKAAEESIAQNNLSQAMEYQRQIIQTYPNSVYAFEAWGQIARLAVKTQNFTEVQSAIEQLCTIYQDMPQMYLAVFRVVRDCMDAKNYSQAYSICNTAKTHLSSHPRAMLISGWEGMVSAHEGNFQQARQMKEAVLNSELAPTDFLEAMDNIGWGFYCAGQWDEAVDIYRQALDRYPDPQQAVNLGYHVVQTCMAKGDIQAVRSEIRTFTSQYKDNPDFQKLLCRLADQQYRTIQTCLQNQDDAALGRWTEMLLTEYSQCDNAFGLAGRLAGHLRRQVKRQEAIEIYQELLTRYCSHQEIAGIQDALVETYADMGDLVKAGEAIKTDIEKYPGRRQLLRMITRVAVETARAGDTEKAMELTQAIFDQNPQGTDQLFAYTTQARVYVHQGRDDEAQKLVDDMLLRFKDYPNDLSYHLFGVGEEYYYRAGKLMKSNDPSGGKIAAQKAINFWQKPIISSNPGIPHMLVNCYQWLGQPQLSTAFYNKISLANPMAGSNESPPTLLAGDRYCGAYAVWHLLKYYGKIVTIDAIADQMQIPTKGYATIQDIVNTLTSYDLPAQPMRIQNETAAKINTPFIQYLIPLSDNTLGHFVLCIPTGSGKAVILDGVKAPSLIDLSHYHLSESYWNGIVILIEQSREDYLGQIISCRLLWKTGLVASYCWLQDESVECFRRTEEYYNRLNEQQLANLRGGWTDLDCLTAGDPGTNCLTYVSCVRDQDCNGAAVVCDDDTVEKICQLTEHGWTPCYYNPAHMCGPKQRIQPVCGDTRCLREIRIENQLCTGMAREWIYQCYDGWL